MPTQVFLHPHRTIGARYRPYTPINPVPPFVRDFGYIPDESALQPGDLLLVSALHPPRSSKTIMIKQERGGYHPDDARWHHAAVYLGDMLLCEATVLHGVQVASLFKYVGTHLLRFRRDTTLPIEKSWRLALEAMQRLRTMYGLRAIPYLWIQSIKGFWRPEARASNVRAIICSQLYADAYTLASGKLVICNSIGPAIPAALSVTETLKDVELGWLKLGDLR